MQGSVSGAAPAAPPMVAACLAAKARHADEEVQELVRLVYRCVLGERVLIRYLLWKMYLWGPVWLAGTVGIRGAQGGAGRPADQAPHRRHDAGRRSSVLSHPPEGLRAVATSLIAFGAPLSPGGGEKIWTGQNGAV